MDGKLIEIKSSKYEKSSHTSSVLQPDTLFHFMDNVDWLIDLLNKKYIYARYCKEDIRYLGIDGMNFVSIPMRCFCDIKLHELQLHTEYYGANGIAFPKEWGMNKGIQPIHYFNPNSKLREEFTRVFNKAATEVDNQTELEKILENYLVHQMVYYKPYSGDIINRKTEDIEQKCFMDEREWRFVADVSLLQYDPIIINTDSNKDYIKTLTSSLTKHDEIALQFEYEDIKYLIVENITCFLKLTEAIKSLNIEEEKKLILISKIIIWDNSKGDF